jgi:hypothetical protein
MLAACDTPGKSRSVGEGRGSEKKSERRGVDEQN